MEENIVKDVSSNQPTECKPLLEAFTKPEWVHDTEATTCFNCHQQFDLIERRHHCRRCQNVFCGKCSKYKRPVLLYQLNTPSRLCANCYEEVPQENEFIAHHLPLLQEGSTFTQKVMLGKKPVVMKLNTVTSALEYRELGKSGRAQNIFLHSVTSVGKDSSQGFQINIKGETAVVLQANSGKERDLWVTALSEASQRVRAPDLKTQVEMERRKQASRKKMFDFQMETNRKKEQRASQRQQIANKYGLAKESSNGRMKQ